MPDFADKCVTVVLYTVFDANGPAADNQLYSLVACLDCYNAKKETDGIFAYRFFPADDIPGNTEYLKCPTCSIDLVHQDLISKVSAAFTIAGRDGVEALSDIFEKSAEDIYSYVKKKPQAVTTTPDNQPAPDAV